MTDKEKQIEEIANAICSYCKEMTEEKGGKCERGKECYEWRLKEARSYYEQGYRKIPEGSVVISADYELPFDNKDECENETIKFNMQETEKASFNINQMNGNLVLENQQLKDRIAELEEYIKGNEQDAKAFINGWHKDLETELKQFAEKLKSYIHKCENISNDTDNDLCETIDETLKEFLV